MEPELAERIERRRVGSLAEVIPVAAVEPDGLIVRTDGTYVRLLRCPQVLQPFRGGVEHRDRLRARLAQLAARIPDRQSLQVVVEASLLDPELALARDWEEIEAAAASRADVGDGATAEAMMRFGYGLEQTVRQSAPELGAVELGWWVVVPWRPAGGVVRSRLRNKGARRLRNEPHERAAYDSERVTETIASELAGIGCEARRLDGPEAIALLWHWLHPGRPQAASFEELPRVVADDDPEAALSHRQRVLEAITADAGLDLARPDYLEYVADGQIESIGHLTTPPDASSLWWLLYLMEAPPPWRLSVHLHAVDRARTRRSYRLRRRRMWADIRRRERDGKLITPEQEEQDREAGEIDAELRLSASSVYDVSVYMALRECVGREEWLADSRRLLAREFEGLTDARTYQGRFTGREAWVSTLPLGDDRVMATRRYATRNVCDCIPLLSTHCGAERGVPLGYAVPGQTLERVDFFDPRYRTHVALITGGSGSGKTVCTNAVLARNIARGARGWVIDRSSSEDEGGTTRAAGHYEALVELVPGARMIHFGGEVRDAVLCPWDVREPAAVGGAKIKFLLALHTLLVGDPGGEGDERVLDGRTRALLERGIEAVYARAARTGERPRETLLREELLALARAEDADESDGDPALASAFRNLAAELHPYCEGGAHDWLCDAQTTIDEEAPLVLCDLAGLHDDLAGPVMLTIVDHIGRVVERRRARHRRGEEPLAGPWAGRAFVVIDEAWAQMRSRAAGRWLNEWARRTRHMSCAMLVVTQHLADFANEQGAALLRNSVLRIIFHTSAEELAYAREALGLDAQDLETITRELETRKGEFSTAFVDSEVHGRGTVRIYLGDMEYWVASSDPYRDQPIRELARREGGDAWAALRLLVEPEWHLRRARELLGGSENGDRDGGAEALGDAHER
ncbi:MAG: hypothetical protein GEU88_15350 [Solirubrobacterales bacterium]|nr:hypothetical protein [Solirubrobacterales bacterium]